jgi:hypothetical protein
MGAVKGVGSGAVAQLLKKERRKIQVDFDLTKRIDSVLQIKKH